MPSVKQIEAFYWSGILGSFVAAADRLNTTQSNISKRIQELELSLRIQVFDRTKRTIRLTAKGEELMRVSEVFLRTHGAVMAVGKRSTVAPGPFRIGVTEAVALTWLPKFCATLTAEYPGLIPVSRVDTPVALNDALVERKLDLVIATKRRLDADIVVTELASVRRVWLASPAFLPDEGVLSAERLASLPILGHTAEVAINRYLRERGFIAANIIASSTNLTALARMAIAGMGITYLHEGIFQDDIRRGRLRVIQTEFELPQLEYVALHRDDPVSPYVSQIAAMAKEVCDFQAEGVL